MKSSTKENILIFCIVYLVMALPVCFLTWLMSGRGLIDQREEYIAISYRVGQLESHIKHVHGETNKDFTSEPIVDQREIDRKSMIKSEFVRKWQGTTWDEQEAYKKKYPEDF